MNELTMRIILIQKRTDKAMSVSTGRTWLNSQTTQPANQLTNQPTNKHEKELRLECIEVKYLVSIKLFTNYLYIQRGKNENMKM